MSATDYEHRGTCDVCAQGGVPVRSDGDAYVCADCDRRHFVAVAAASRASGIHASVLGPAIDAYFDAMTALEQRS